MVAGGTATNNYSSGPVLAPLKNQATGSWSEASKRLRPFLLPETTRVAARRARPLPGVQGTNEIIPVPELWAATSL